MGVKLSVEGAAYARVVPPERSWECLHGLHGLRPDDAADCPPPSPRTEREQCPDAKQVQRYRHLPGPLPSPLLVAAVTAVVVLVLWPSSACGMRGPHHPRGEVIKHQHYQPRPEQHTKITQDEMLLQDKEHIREDLGDWVTDEALDSMSPEELQFHYFKAHDSDQNTKLDGLELLRAIMHTAEDHDHGEHEDQEENSVQEQAKHPTPIEYYIELIDEVLREDDADNDGYLSYAEYVANRNQSSKRRAADMMENPAALKALPGLQTK
ncbi:uncharacterized protein LOC117643301 [Thrips palmi]|uniref:Uncharacterized protein LOC117643301 n=1 Tax=Thrips palmi TaxID=161013 RepID=A0A6P8YLN1_THRPL|nr:uncharacterized protein LOC117643301 [Thrips palmi]